MVTVRTSSVVELSNEDWHDILGILRVEALTVVHPTLKRRARYLFTELERKVKNNES